MNFAIFLILANVVWGGYATWLSRHVPQEGGWDTVVGRSSSI